jgi:hypothetical protein
MQKLAKMPVYYWHTPSGRTTAMYIMTTAGAFAGALTFCPHNIGKDFLKNQVALYK